MSWQLNYSRRAIRDMRAVPEQQRRNIRERLRDAASDPGSADLRKLGGGDKEWRLRVGRWRVIIGFDNDSGTMTVLRVLPRDRAYR
jgi:mRNA-degrading endonuclease RelE of RelBE toxin-antitoxin system